MVEFLKVNVITLSFPILIGLFEKVIAHVINNQRLVGTGHLRLLVLIWKRQLCHAIVLLPIFGL